MDRFLQILPLLRHELMGNTVAQLLTALLIFIGIKISIFVFRKGVLKKLHFLSRMTKTELDDRFVEILEEIPHSLYWYVAFYAALKFLNLHPYLEKALDGIFIVLLFVWLTSAAITILDFGMKKAMPSQDPAANQNAVSFQALSMLFKIILWAVACILIMTNLGINVTALAASLGIGGIAIALAAQNILGDLFSSFSIYFDKPFEIGDYITVGEHRGTVKHIGLKTTRITSLQGEEIVISNHELTNSRVRNFKKMQQRRIEFQMGVTYQTPLEKLKKIPALVRDIFQDIEKVTLERVHFKEYAPSSLVFEVVYFIRTGDYNEYMDTQERINLDIFEKFEQEKIEFAYPTQTLYLHGASPISGAPDGHPDHRL